MGLFSKLNSMHVSRGYYCTRNPNIGLEEMANTMTTSYDIVFVSMSKMAKLRPSPEKHVTQKTSVTCSLKK